MAPSETPRAWAIWVLDCPLRLRTVRVTISSGVSLGAIGSALPGQGRRLARVRGRRPAVYTNRPVGARNASCPLTLKIARPLTFDAHVLGDLPEPRVEWHRYRRHIYRCRHCRQTCQGRGDLELPGAHSGPRARLLTCYGRAHLGISLGKTRDLLPDFFGLTISRAGLLGHLRWGGQLFAPVVDELLARLRQSPAVQGDET